MVRIELILDWLATSVIFGFQLVQQGSNGR